MKANQQQNGGENQAENPSTSAGSSSAPAFTAGDTTNSADSHNQDPNDFRSRFHRSLVAPSPFGAAPVAIAQAAMPVPTAIDPRLGGLNNPTEFAEMVAKMAAQAASQSLADNEKDVNDEAMSVDASGEADGEAASTSEEAEVEAETEPGDDANRA